MQTVPGATSKLIAYRLEADLFPSAPWGWIIHRPNSNGSLFDYFNGLVKPNRKFSHIWVSKTGTVEQYQTLDRQSWAQRGGNAQYWSAECEGTLNEPLTPQQISALARFHIVTNTLDALANRWGERGIGVHYMVTPTLCPGPITATQRTAILTTVHQLRHPAPNMPPYPGINGGGAAGVKAIQGRLGNLVVDGYYGPLTRARVIWFQRTRHLAADGIVGPITWKALFG